MPDHLMVSCFQHALITATGIHNSLHSTCARLVFFFVLSPDTYLPGKKCGEHYFFACLEYTKPQAPTSDRRLLPYSLPSMILAFHPIAVMQLPQQHQTVPRKCTDGVYLMYSSQSSLIAAQISLILKESVF